MIIGGFDQTTFSGASISRSPFGVGSGFSNPDTGRVVLPVPCTISNLTLQLDTPPGAGLTVTCSVQKNGVATALTVSITGVLITFVADNITVVPFAVGDELNFHLTNSGSSAITRTNWSAVLKS